MNTPCPPASNIFTSKSLETMTLETKNKYYNIIIIYVRYYCVRYYIYIIYYIYSITLYILYITIYIKLYTLYIHYILYYTQCILYIHYIYYIIYYTAKNVIGLRISRGRAHFGFSTWALNTSAYTRGGADSEVGGGHPNGGATSQRMPQPPEAGDTRNGICPRASGGGVVLPRA